MTSIETILETSPYSSLEVREAARLLAVAYAEFTRVQAHALRDCVAPTIVKQAAGLHIEAIGALDKFDAKCAELDADAAAEQAEVAS
jgi:sulfur relay (sulfurtransferase) DsrF/TusC family protein